MKSAMNISSKNKDEAIKFILKSHLKIDKNLFLSHKLFVAKSAINWIFDHGKDINIIKYYLKDVEKYLNGDLELLWEDGKILKKKANSNEKNNTTKKQ